MYSYKYGGKDGQDYQLVESRDLVVVRTKGGTDLKSIPLSKASNDLLPRLIPVGAFPEADVTVFRVVGENEQAVRALTSEVRRTLSKEDSIRFAGKVLQERKSGEIVVYTENFFVKFFDEVSDQRCREVLKNYELKIIEKLKFAVNSFFARAEAGTGLKIFDIAKQLLNEKEVELCHPELIKEKKFKGIHAKQWHLGKTNLNGTDVEQHVEIEGAWKHTRGEGVTIAVIDDGVDMGHEEFQGNGKIVAPRDTLLRSDDANPKFEDENHGTACAGVACAGGKKSASGVAPEARLMPIRSGGLGSISEANAFVWAADKGADVISCSWGPADGPWWAPNDPKHFVHFGLPDSSRLAIDYAVRTGRDGKGCVIFWAAGNGNESVSFDGYATYHKVMAIAACNDHGRRSVYSDYGNEIWCCFPSNDFYWPRLNHPRPISEGIYTTDRMGSFGYGTENYTSGFGGTSSACPGAAGVAALILSVNPELNWRQVREIIKNSCDKIDEEFGNYNESGHSPYYGYGRLNARKAVENAQATLKKDESFVVKGLAHFNKTVNVPLIDGQTSPDHKPDYRLLGIQLNTEPFHPDLHIRYQAVINNKGKTEVGQDGQLIGTTDRRRKLIGLKIELAGALAAEYDVEYGVWLNNSTEMVKGKNGEFVGKASGAGEAIERIMVDINRSN